MSDSEPIVVRRLGREEVEAFREISLESLRLDPESFSASYEDERLVPVSQLVERLEANVVLGAFVDVDVALAGVVTYSRQTLRKRRHVAFVTGMYVRSAYRSRGIASALLTRIIDVARTEVDQLELYVAAGNVGARRLYRRFGFVPYGVMPRSLRVDGADHDAEMFALIFR